MDRCRWRRKKRQTRKIRIKNNTEIPFNRDSPFTRDLDVSHESRLSVCLKVNYLAGSGLWQYESRTQEWHDLSDCSSFLRDGKRIHDHRPSLCGLLAGFDYSREAAIRNKPKLGSLLSNSERTVWRLLQGWPAFPPNPLPGCVWRTTVRPANLSF